MAASGSGWPAAGAFAIPRPRFWPCTLASSVRSHGSIENELHWVLDVAFGEDGLRTRMGNGPETGAILRHLTLNMLRQDPNTKRSIRHRRLKAALSQEYRLAALLGFPAGSASEGHGSTDQNTTTPSVPLEAGGGHSYAK